MMVVSHRHSACLIRCPRPGFFAGSVEASGLILWTVLPVLWSVSHALFSWTSAPLSRSQPPCRQRLLSCLKLACWRRRIHRSALASGGVLRASGSIAACPGGNGVQRCSPPLIACGAGRFLRWVHVFFHRGGSWSCLCGSFSDRKGGIGVEIVSRWLPALPDVL